PRPRPGPEAWRWPEGCADRRPRSGGTLRPGAGWRRHARAALRARLGPGGPGSGPPRFPRAGPRPGAGPAPPAASACPHPAAPGAAAQAERGRELGLTPGAVQVALHRLRTRFAATLRGRVAATLDNPSAADVDEEIRALFAVLAG